MSPRHRPRGRTTPIHVYKWDALGRRVGRDDGTDNVVYFQDGQQTLADYAAGVAASSPTYTYIYASYVDEPVLRTDSSGTKLYYHRNQQYSIVALTDGSGGIVERYAYTAYGEPTILSGSGSPQSFATYKNRYTYTGREWDEKLELYHYRVCIYSPEAGRFVSRDPMRYVDGASLYASYFGLRNVEPTGLHFATSDPPHYMDTDDLSDCYDRWGIQCKNDCAKIYGGDWFPNYRDWERCIADCDSQLVECSTLFVPNITPLPCDSPECDEYAEDDEYANSSARCFCKCAGNSEWSQFVRGCLREMYDRWIDPHEAHMMCYARADAQGFKGGRPVVTLAYCYAMCLDRDSSDGR